MHADKLSSLAQLMDRAHSDTLSFPTTVNTALRLQQALGDPDCHAADIHRLLLSEPALSARAVAMANSVMYAHGHVQAVTSVRAAADRLGQRNLLSLATAAVIYQLKSGIRDAALRARAAQLWSHSVHVAALAHEIAGTVTHTDADTAMFAGIVHEVAGLFVLAEADRTPGLYQQVEGQLPAALEIIGRALMRQLGVPTQVADAINALPGASVLMPPEGLRDTLLLAKALAPVASPLPQLPSTTSERLRHYLDSDPTLYEMRNNPSAEAKALIAVLLS